MEENKEVKEEVSRIVKEDYEASDCTGEKPMCPSGSRCVCGSNKEWTCEGVA